MDRMNDEQLDRLLGDFFAAELDPQVGRAGRAIRPNMRRPLLARPWFWMSAGGAAVAACVAIVSSIMLFGGGNPVKPANPVLPVAPPAVAVKPVVEVQRSTQWQTWDGGTMAVDEHTPVRVLHRQQIERVEWVDPGSGARMERSTPRDEILLIGMDKY